jgi:hypothetical protein
MRTFTVSLSTADGWIAAALASFPQLKLPAAATPAYATVVFKNSRLLIASLMFISIFCEAVRLENHARRESLLILRLLERKSDPSTVPQAMDIGHSQELFKMRFPEPICSARSVALRPLRSQATPGANTVPFHTALMLILRSDVRLLRRAGGLPSPRMRDGKPERGSRTFIRYGPELATVTFDNGTTDRQTDPHTAALRTMIRALRTVPN